MNVPVDISLIHPDAVAPAYQTPGAVAFDIAVVEEKTIQPGAIEKIQTGLVICVPKDHLLMLAPRSSNTKKGIQLANSVGIIDQDYCGPTDQLFLALYNIGTEPYTVQKGERIAQGMIIPVARAEFRVIDELKQSDRGGFGTTG